MKTLPKTFEKRVEGAQGYKVTFEQLERVQHVAAFKRTAPEWVDYETICIQESQGGKMKVKDEDGNEKTVVFEAKELYPSSASWGTDGFTFQTEAGARTKMAELLAIPGNGKAIAADHPNNES